MYYYTSNCSYLSPWLYKKSFHDSNYQRNRINMVVRKRDFLFSSLRKLLVILCLSLSLPFHSSVHSECIKKPVIFVFGDSNSDTGGFSFGLGFNFGPPHGRTFNQPSGRLCDGRLIIDFLCKLNIYYPLFCIYFNHIILAYTLYYRK